MPNNNKINEEKLENVSGGVMIDGQMYVKINEDDIEGYEYRCKTCGYIGYSKTTDDATCPRCNAQNKYYKTGRFYMDYNKCNGSATKAYYYND